MPSDSEAKRRLYWRNKIRNEFSVEPDLRIKNVDLIKEEYYRLLHSRAGHVEVEKKLEVVRADPLVPQYDEHHPETVDEGEFHVVTSGGYTKRELRMKDSKFGALMKEMTTGYIPPPGEVAEFTPKQQIEILRHIPWKPESLLHGKGGIKVDFDGVPIEEEEKREGRLRF